MDRIKGLEPVGRAAYWNRGEEAGLKRLNLSTTRKSTVVDGKEKEPEERHIQNASILARHPHHVTRSATFCSELDSEARGNRTCPIAMGEVHADKTLRSSQAWGGLATRRVAAPVGFFRRPVFGTDGKGVH